MNKNGIYFRIGYSSYNEIKGKFEKIIVYEKFLSSNHPLIEGWGENNCGCYRFMKTYGAKWMNSLVEKYRDRYPSLHLLGEADYSCYEEYEGMSLYNLLPL